MNNFERHLARQPMRQIPPEWRAEILKNAAAEVNAERPVGREFNCTVTTKSWLHELLWPCPQAWAALAAVWVIILGLHSAHSGEQTTATNKPASPAPETVIALREQRRLLAELMAPLTEVVEPPKPEAPRPRSARPALVRPV